MKKNKTEQYGNTYNKKVDKKLNRNFTPLGLFVSAAALEACVEGGGNPESLAVITVPYDGYPGETTLLFLEGNPDSIEDGVNDGFVITQEQLGGAQEITVVISGVTQKTQAYFQMVSPPDGNQGQTYSQLVAQNQQSANEYASQNARPIDGGSIILSVDGYTYLNSLQLVIRAQQFNEDIEITITATVSYSGGNTEQPIVQQLHKAVYKITPNKQPELNIIGEQQITQIDEGLIDEQMSVAEYQVTDQDHILTSFGEENFILYYLKQDDSLEEMVGGREKFKIVRDTTNGNVEVVINQYTVLDYDGNSNDGGRLHVGSDGTKYYKLLLAAFDDISIQYKQNAQGEPEYNPTLQQLSFLKPQSSTPRIIESQSIEELRIDISDVVSTNVLSVPLEHGGMNDVRMLFLRGNPYDNTPNPETDGFANLNAAGQFDFVKVTFSNLPNISLARIGMVLPTDRPTIDPTDAAKIILPTNSASYNQVQYNDAVMLDTFAVNQRTPHYLQEGDAIFLTKEQYNYLDTLYLSVLQNIAVDLQDFTIEIKEFTVDINGFFSFYKEDVFVVDTIFDADIGIANPPSTTDSPPEITSQDIIRTQIDEAAAPQGGLPIATYTFSDTNGQGADRSADVTAVLLYHRKDGSAAEQVSGSAFILSREPNVNNQVAVMLAEGQAVDYDDNSDSYLFESGARKYYKLELILLDEISTGYRNADGSIDLSRIFPQSRQLLEIDIEKTFTLDPSTMPTLTRVGRLDEIADATGNADFDEVATLNEALIARYNSNDPDEQSASLQYRLFYKQSDGMLVEIGNNDPYFSLSSAPYSGQGNVDDVVNVYVKQGATFDYETDGDANLITQQAEKYYDLLLVAFDSQLSSQMVDSIDHVDDLSSIGSQSKKGLRIEINNVNEQPVLDPQYTPLETVMLIKYYSTPISLDSLLQGFSDPDGIDDITDVILKNIPVGVEISYHSITDNAERKLEYSQDVRLAIADIGIYSGQSERTVNFDSQTLTNTGYYNNTEIFVSDSQNIIASDAKSLPFVIDNFPSVNGVANPSFAELFGTIDEFTYLTQVVYRDYISDGAIVIKQYQLTDPIDSLADGSLNFNLLYVSQDGQQGYKVEVDDAIFGVRRVANSQDLVEVFLKFDQNDFSNWDYETTYQYQLADKSFILHLYASDPNTDSLFATATIDIASLYGHRYSSLTIKIGDVVSGFSPAVDALDERDATLDVIDISYSEDSTLLDIALMEAVAEVPKIFRYSLEMASNSGNNLPFSTVSSGERDATDFIKIDPATGQLSFKSISELPTEFQRSVDHENPYYDAGSIDAGNIEAANSYALRVKVEELDGNNNVVATSTKEVRVHVTDANEPPSLRQIGQDEFAIGQIRYGQTREISIERLRQLFEDSDVSADYNVIDKIYFDLPTGIAPDAISYKNADGTLVAITDLDGDAASNEAPGVYDFAAGARLVIDSSVLAADSEYTISYKVFDNAGLNSSDSGRLTFSTTADGEVIGFEESSSFLSGAPSFEEIFARDSLISSKTGLQGLYSADGQLEYAAVSFVDFTLEGRQYQYILLDARPSKSDGYSAYLTQPVWLRDPFDKSYFLYQGQGLRNENGAPNLFKMFSQLSDSSESFAFSQLLPFSISQQEQYSLANIGQNQYHLYKDADGPTVPHDSSGSMLAGTLIFAYNSADNNARSVTVYLKTPNEGDERFFSVETSRISTEQTDFLYQTRLYFKQLPDYENPFDKDATETLAAANEYTIEIVATDNHGASLTEQFTVSVTNTDEAPHFVNVPAFDDFVVPVYYNKGSGSLTFFTAKAVDADGDAISYSLAGRDAELFEINSNTGELKYKPNIAPAIGSDDVSHELEIIASSDADLADDIVALTGVLNVVVIPTDNYIANSAPVITSAAQASFNENANIKDAVIDVDATDSNTEQLLRYSFGTPNTGDAKYFIIDSLTGEIFQKFVFDYETPFGGAQADNQYIFEVIVSDTLSVETRQMITLNVQDVVEQPVVEPPIISSGDMIFLSGGIASGATILITESDDGNYHNYPVFEYYPTSIPDFSFYTFSSSLPAFVELKAAGGSYYEYIVVRQNQLHMGSYSDATESYSETAIIGDVFFMADSTVGFADLDGDGLVDMLAVNLSGSLEFYRGTGTLQDISFQQDNVNTPLKESIIYDNVKAGKGAVLKTFDQNGDGIHEQLLITAADGTSSVWHIGYDVQNQSPSFTEILARDNQTNPFANVVPNNKVAAMTLGDIDSDLDLDLVITDKNGALLYYENTGDEAEAVFTLRAGIGDPFSELGSIGSSTIFSTKLFDIDSDGDLDFIFSAYGLGNTFYYENTGTIQSASFDSNRKEIFVGATPRESMGNIYIDFADINVENGAPNPNGVLDVLLSNLYMSDTGTFVQKVEHYELGTVYGNIKFLHTASQEGSFTEISDLSVRAVFAYINSDELVDLVYGNSEGEILYYENSGAIDSNGKIEYIKKTGADNPFNGIDVGFNAAPVFADLDGDGDDDLSIISDEGDIIHYIENLWSDGA